MNWGVERKHVKNVPVLPAGIPGLSSLLGYKFWLDQIIQSITTRIKYDAKRAYIQLSRVRSAEERAEGRVREAEGRVREAESRVRSTEERADRLIQEVMSQGEERVREAEQKAEASEERERAAERRVREAEQRAQASEERAVAAERAMRQWVVERREIHITEDVLGKGGWGEVKVAQFRGTKVAAKSLYQAIRSGYYHQLFIREMNMAARIRHPNLVQFIGACIAHGRWDGDLD